MDSIVRVVGMLNGYQQTCVIVAARRLGLFDALGSGPASDVELAARTGARPDSLVRLLRGLQVMGLVEPDEAGALALTDAGRLLTDSALSSVADLIGEEYLRAWADLADSARTGEVAFDAAFGMSVWEHRERNPEVGEAFNRVTASMQRHATHAVVQAYDFSTTRLAVDVGGGFGHLLAGVLESCAGRGVLFDLPHVVERAREELGARGLAERVQFVPGSFLESVPRGGDTYLLKHCLHNWTDDEAVAILGHCRDAMDEDAVLLVLEDILPARVGPEAAPTVMLDLHMLAVLGGRERTEAEYQALMARAGLSLQRCIYTAPGAPDILEARRASR